MARQGAALEGAAITWPVGVVAIIGLALLCLAQMVVLTHVLRHRWPCLTVALLVVLYVVHPPGRPGWPPEGWVMVMCDVGQGDGLVLNAGHDVAVVVDAGPDPAAIDRCLDRLEVSSVALVVLTHFHADHVDGLDGVGDGRSLAEIEVSPLSDPLERVDMVAVAARGAGVPVTVGTSGTIRTIGQVTLRTIGPLEVAGSPSYGSQGSAANNASLVMVATVAGVDILLAGDSEVEEQEAIVRSGASLQVDVLKVAHHGSGNQDDDFVLASGASVALISVGADNDYGHPAEHLLGLLRVLGARVYRTDQSGDIAVVERGGAVSVVPWR